MGQLLKLAGIVAVTNLLFGDKITGAIYDRIQYSFDRLRSGDIGFGFNNGEPNARLRIGFNFRHDFGVSDTLTGLQLSFTQKNMLLGHLNHQLLIDLPSGEEVDIPLTITIPAGPFLERLTVALTPRNNNSLLAPLVITGKAHLASGISIPISRSLSLANLIFPV